VRDHVDSFIWIDWVVAAGQANGVDSMAVFKGILGNASTFNTGYVG